MVNKLLIMLLCCVLVSCAAQQLKPKEQSINCYPGAAKELLRWNKSNGKESKGLTKRRQEEMNLFLEDCNVNY
jgi:hypothetical protein